LHYFLLRKKVNVTKVQTIYNFGQGYHFTVPTRKQPRFLPFKRMPHTDLILLKARSLCSLFFLRIFVYEDIPERTFALFASPGNLFLKKGKLIGSNFGHGASLTWI
jgi:hypothetical protein